MNTTRLRPGIPWYVHPAGDVAAWQQLAERFAGAGAANGFAVLNVHNGPGGPDDPYYGPAVAQLRERAPGLVLLGYVDIGYGTRPRDVVLADAAAWTERYGIRGVMLDQFPSGIGTGPGGDVSAALGTVAALREAGAEWVAGNPGTVPSPQVRAALDITCEFEGPAGEYSGSGLAGGPGSWHLVHSCGPEDLTAADRVAAAAGAEYVFFTDQLMPHPWGGFPGRRPR